MVKKISGGIGNMATNIIKRYTAGSILESSIYGKDTKSNNSNASVLASKIFKKSDREEAGVFKAKCKKMI